MTTSMTATTTSNTTTAIAPHVPSPLLIRKNHVSVEPVENTDEEADDEPEEFFRYEEECDEEEDTTVSSK